MALRHLISPLDLTEEETTRILDLADRIGTHKEAYAHLAEGKQLATLFYEPSTRTRLSFESAMLSLGGQTLGFAGAEQRRNRCRYRPGSKLLRRYYCHASSKRRSTALRLYVCNHSGH